MIGMQKSEHEFLTSTEYKSYKLSALVKQMQSTNEPKLMLDDEAQGKEKL